jgi:hypothetical protein
MIKRDNLIVSNLTTLFELHNCVVLNERRQQNVGSCYNSIACPGVIVEGGYVCIQIN